MSKDSNFKTTKKVLARLGISFLLILVCFELYIFTIKPEMGGCEAVIVFTGERQRLEEGAALFHHTQAKYFIISGVQNNIKKFNFKDILQKYDIAKSKVILGKLAKNTKGNAAELYIISNMFDIKSMCLVTANYHMPRSLLEAWHYNQQVKIQPWPVKIHAESIKKACFIVFYTIKESIACVLLIISLLLDVLIEKYVLIMRYCIQSITSLALLVRESLLHIK